MSQVATATQRSARSPSCRAPSRCGETRPRTRLASHRIQRQEHIDPNTANDDEPSTSSAWPRTVPAVAVASCIAAASVGCGAASATVLDAAAVHKLVDILRPTFSLLTFLYIVRIPMTWYPSIDGKSFPWVLSYAPTEPFLAVSRKIVPLVGGVDVTPIVWVGLLSFFSEILLGPQGLLVLIERQGGI